ncbi:unnamed protein product [Urochloa humidicola]
MKKKIQCYLYFIGLHSRRLPRRTAAPPLQGRASRSAAWPRRERAAEHVHPPAVAVPSCAGRERPGTSARPHP